MPLVEIDHINGVRNDNRICNLRDATPQINMQNKKTAHKNNKLGILGVSKRKDGKFQAQIKSNGERFHLGVFNTADDASAAYWARKIKIHSCAAAEIAKNA